MRYWKCTCCSTVLVTQKQESRENYCRPTCPIAACKGSNYQEISRDEFTSMAIGGEPKKTVEDAPTGDVATCFACNSPLHSQESDVALDERLRRAGMMTLSEIFNNPMAKFQVHAGVKDLDTFYQWLIMRRDEFTKQQALMTLADKVEGDMFEWTVAHSSSFREVFYNFEVAKIATDELIEGQKKIIQALQLQIKEYNDLAKIMGAMTVKQMYHDYKALTESARYIIPPIDNLCDELIKNIDFIPLNSNNSINNALLYANKKGKDSIMELTIIVITTEPLLRDIIKVIAAHINRGRSLVSRIPIIAVDPSRKGWQESCAGFYKQVLVFYSKEVNRSEVLWLSEPYGQIDGVLPSC